jgi:protein gp37
MAESSIEWTEHTWNPTTGCTKVSPGCKHCYAEVMARRLNAMGAAGYENGFHLTTHPSRLQQPLQRNAPTTYFVNSMSDLFHEDVADVFIDRVLATCRKTPQHTYQILTKRAERLPVFFAKRPVPDNVWLGVSVEDRRYGVPRIAQLRKVRARVRFLSVEPLLENLGTLDLRGVHWVIVGGESGHGARPMHPEWADSVRIQAQAQGAAFFFKQWGAWGPDGVRRNKKSNGRELAGRLWDQFPIRIVAAAAA